MRTRSRLHVLRDIARFSALALLLGGCSANHASTNLLSEGQLPPFKTAHFERHGFPPEDYDWREEFPEDLGNDIAIGLERSSCYGNCPVYTMAYAGTGEACYCGFRYSDPVGVFNGVVEPKLVQHLVGFATEMGFFEMPHAFVRFTTDGPSTFSLACTTEREHLLENYDGGAPDSVWALENLVETLHSVTRWESAPDESCDECLERVLQACPSLPTVRAR